MQSVLDIFCKARYTKNAKRALQFPRLPFRRTGRGCRGAKNLLPAGRIRARPALVREVLFAVKTRIPQLRKERRLSQGELADAVGVTRQTITSLEVGKYTASLVLAYKIARYFGLTIEEVFDFSDLEG